MLGCIVLCFKAVSDDGKEVGCEGFKKGNKRWDGEYLITHTGVVCKL